MNWIKLQIKTQTATANGGKCNKGKTMDTQYSTQQITFQAPSQRCVFVNNTGFSNTDEQSPLQDQVEHCEAWIRKFCTPRKTINYSRGSYSLKHNVENWKQGLPSDRSYVSNGAFIAAALNLGYQYRRSGINANFNMNILDKEWYS